MISIFDLPKELIDLKILSVAKADRGKIVRKMQGMCADVYIVDRGNGVYPNGVAVKIPRIPIGNPVERATRFLREIQFEHQTFRHRFVSWAYDYDVVFDTPVALYRLWDGDLSDWTQKSDFSVSGRVAALAYICSGLQHCRLRRLHAHQDLKPQNILMRRTSAVDALGDIMVWPMIADFGLANLYQDADHAHGAKPYKAPEQWLHEKVVPESDVFSLGVIACELLSNGTHPIGEKTIDWWPVPVSSNSKKWLRDDIWAKWAKDGNRLNCKEFAVTGAADIIEQCLQPDYTKRPTLCELQQMAVDLLRNHAPEAFAQVDFQIAHADMTVEKHDWEYRNRRLDRLVQHFSSI
jgi:eukaryotic-like serine/threonine-protein kinase